MELLSDDIFDTTAFENTPLSLEITLVDGYEHWATTEVAGLQYYSYNKKDELIGRILPANGDVISIMRRPDNHADKNACELWWRNQHHLGHLPRDVARNLYEAIDEGKSARCYVVDRGNGTAWSMKVILVGSAVYKLHKQRIAECIKERERDYKEYLEEQINEVWPSGQWGAEPYEEDCYCVERPIKRQYRARPTQEQADANDMYNTAMVNIRLHNLKDAVVTLMPLATNKLELSQDYGEPGKCYSWWTDVPGGLKTKTAWAEIGYKVSKKAVPYAKISYSCRYDYKEYQLYRSCDLTPIKRPQSFIEHDVEREMQQFYTQYDFEA